MTSSQLTMASTYMSQTSQHVPYRSPDHVSHPMAHMGFEGSRHLIPERLPSARRERTVGIRVIDLNQDTVDNIQLLSGSLKRLDLSDVKIDILSEDIIEGLFRLEKINLNHNFLTEDSFPENFKDLENLIELSAHDNQIKVLPAVIRKLKNLQRLKLSQNLIEHVDGLERLKRLQVLVLDGNNIDNLTKEVFTNLKRLEILHCVENHINGIPSDIRNLRHLRDLDLSGNNLSYIPPEVFLLPRLEVLNASCNQISRVPTLNMKGRQKKKLTAIDLSDNLLIRFPCHLMFMTDKLDLCRNKIKTIPLSLIDKLDQVPDLQLLLRDNPLTIPPQEICDCGLWSIIQYFMEIKTDMRIYQGLKVLVLGAPGQGKTSLVQTLVDQQARSTEEESTVGIDIYEHSIDLDEGNPLGKHLNLSLWDFSGNPRYSFQHQFFVDQPALVLLVFNMAEYNEANFKSQIGSWIDLIISRSNRLIALPVGTHVDKIRPKKAAAINKQVLQSIHKYIKDVRASIDREIKRIESRQYISPALSEQLKLYINLTKLDTVVHDEVINISSKNFSGIEQLEQAIRTMSENQEVFPNVLRPIPTLWGEVENFVDDHGYAMQIPMMEWDDYVHLVTSKFGMRHLIQPLTIYLHDTGKVIWFYDHPTLKNQVFLRPSWLMDLFKALFRHDVSDIDYTIEESFKQNNISVTKLERMKKEILEEGILDKEYIRSLWSNSFRAESNVSLLEVLNIFLEHFQIGYPVMTKLSRRTSTVSKTGSADKGEKERSDSASTVRSTSHRDSNHQIRLPSDNRLDVTSSLTSRSKTSDKSELPTQSTQPPQPPNISKLFVPWLRKPRPPKSFKDDYQTFSSHPSVAAVFRFPKYIPPGLFETFTVRALQIHPGLTSLHHWKNGLYTRHSEEKIRLYLQRIDHDDGGTCIRCEVRNEEVVQEDQQDKEIEQLWQLLLPFLKDTEGVLSKFTGIRMERYMECPFCHSLSFLGEWLTPKELQAVTNRTCDKCKQHVSTVFLVQPKAKRRVEEVLLQKLLQEAEKRRQEARETEKVKTHDADDISPVAEETTHSDNNTDTLNDLISSPRLKDPEKSLVRKKSHTTHDKHIDDIKDMSPRETKSKHNNNNTDQKKVSRANSNHGNHGNRHNGGKSGEGTSGRVRQVTSGGKNHDKTHSKSEPHLASLAEEP